MTDDKYERGLAKLAEIGSAGGDQHLADLNRIAPDLRRLAVEFVFGDLYSRDDLTLRQRQLVVIGALVAIGDTGPQLAAHVNIALNAGLTEQEIAGAVLQVAPYAGFPRVINAMGVVATTFDDRVS
ncbi:carboxymuconolactone decarboxylase family protein [Actinokineospora sp.]|uniref:carboxymuconolactone decarboxylase family protein n=1 Tax=Actinokineospora sp. TaxID=1872133 RepID=UPI003D6A9684